VNRPCLAQVNTSTFIWWDREREGERKGGRERGMKGGSEGERGREITVSI